MKETERGRTSLFWLCTAVAMVDGFDTLVVSFIAPAFAAEWQLDGREIGLIFAIGLLGAAIGGVLAGRLADRHGRKKLLLICVALFSGATLFSALAPNPELLMLTRFLAGLGLGGAIPAITALVAEGVPPERRTASVTRMFLGFPLGAVAGGALCSAVVPTYGWRPAFWLAALLGIVLLPLLWCWLSEREEGTQHPARAVRSSKPLAEGRAISALCLWAGAFLVLLVSYFLINWTPSILADAGLPERQAILGGVILNLGGVLGAFAATPFLHRVAPFRLVGIALVVGGGLVFLLGARIGDPVQMPFLVFATGMAVIGGQLALPALAAALFPPHVRGTGVGLTMGIGRAGSILGPFCGGLLMDAELGWALLFGLVAVPTLLAGLSMVLAGSRLPH